MKKSFWDKIIDIKVLYFLVFMFFVIGFIIKKDYIFCVDKILENEAAKYEDLRDRVKEQDRNLVKLYSEGLDNYYSSESLFKGIKSLYRNGDEFCVVKMKGKDNSYEYDMYMDKNRILSYNTRIYRGKNEDKNLEAFSSESEIQIYNTNTKKVEKTVDVLAEVKRLINNKDFQSEARKKIENSTLKNKNEKKERLPAKREFQTPIICTDKLGKRIMVFEIPKQQDCKSIDDFEYLAYYIDEGQMKKISFEDLPDRIKDAETDFKTKNQDVSKDSVNKKLENKIIWAQSALKTEEQERNSYCLKNYMDRSAFETLLDSNKIKYQSTYLSDTAESPVHIKMFGSDLEKSSKLAMKFPELVKKYANDDYIIDWYVGDEKNSDEIAKQLLPEGKKLNYDTVHVGDDCAKNLKNASVDSLKDYYKKVKPECILEGRKK
ncbi:hypothetical protein [Lachnobacterium bovis]|uniref:Uncharacterized protein n=2 Tax=Lachnobacterium bovis TaxID=140626 RepID=A0A1H9UFL3_9FIRM|nr:hypothetical protein [Lachnobacterium bovis]SES08139.1 hypothetical protein SAMN02910429_02087 [Lachnobacterium bovis]